MSCLKKDQDPVYSTRRLISLLIRLQRLLRAGCLRTTGMWIRILSTRGDYWPKYAARERVVFSCSVSYYIKRFYIYGRYWLYSVWITFAEMVIQGLSRSGVSILERSHLTNIGIPTIWRRCSIDCLIFIMEIPRRRPGIIVFRFLWSLVWHVVYLQAAFLYINNMQRELRCNEYVDGFVQERRDSTTDLLNAGFSSLH